ncbi:phage tail assembly protein [Altererythrobacter endophyticus]|uniref:Phage tail assembly protein n=2 Tax=Altericroceibacterium endophyticum TaxID=1808508 RepID=A0A6I4T467_9SPHN|nr:phage tail assembly protein [Altericroceibacterium endophyticum]
MVLLSQPIERGEQVITKVQLREPRAGEMRGLSMVDVAKLDTDALVKLLPRISNPPLLAQEIEALRSCDLFALATEIANFLLPEGTRPESLPI